LAGALTGGWGKAIVRRVGGDGWCNGGGLDAVMIVIARLCGRRHLWEHGQPLVGGNCVGFDSALIDLLRKAHRLIAEEINMATNEIVDGRARAAVSDERWSYVRGSRKEQARHM